MRTTQATYEDVVTSRGRGRARGVRTRNPEARHQSPSMGLTSWMLIASLSLHGCAISPSSNDASAADPEAAGWPCDRAAPDSRHCRLQAVAGFEPGADPDVTKFEDVELDATLTASILQGPDGEAQRIMEAWQGKLSPAVTWDQDPQGPVGFEVQGISGSERLHLAAGPGQTPRRFHVVSYRNPRTGSILLLEASAPQDHWQQAWPRMAPVFAAVRLTEDF